MTRDTKEPRLRTTPPKNCCYLTWCNDCECAVVHDEGSCEICESLDLVYFIKEAEAYDRLKAAFDVLEKACVESADLENPNGPNDVCWPASDYMKRHRKALAEARKILEGK